MWESIQNKIFNMIGASKMHTFKIDMFLSSLELLNRIIPIGEEFSEATGAKLRTSIKTYSNHYFESFHRDRIEDLRTMLENEIWQKCPVPKTFSVLDIKEIKDFIDAVSKRPQTPSPISSPHKHKLSFFVQYETVGNPFYVHNNNLSERNDDDDDDDPELAVAYVHEEGDRGAKSTIDSDSAKSESTLLLTTTTINVAKAIGKYLEMMRSLSSISLNVFEGLENLFCFYVYSIFSFFGISDEIEELGFDKELSQGLKRMKLEFAESTEKEDGDSKDGRKVESQAVRIVDEKYLITPVKLSETVDVNQPLTLNALPQRATATESLSFIAETLNAVKPYIEGLVSPSDAKHITNFYRQCVSIIPNLRAYIYKGLFAKMIKRSSLILSISSLKWEIKDISLQANPYVQTMITEFKLFSTRLSNLCQKHLIPLHLKNLFWEHCISVAMECLVSGYANVKKCNPSGRAVMAFDFSTFTTDLERLTTIRPLPNVKFVEYFIKAYYEPDEYLLDWIQNHPEYSKAQLLGLVQQGEWDKRKKAECTAWINANR
eukprot:TRINITY_DN2524_c0_g2_i1.p1 TRINITY_DN2524_c0_g2~~TRINITY_DN2524_c0_g2_i1.p1  ORF type:complete len:585 (+),score=77.44 TRINITY_DN2524_c0_g2_i1:122-1756(+)